MPSPEGLSASQQAQFAQLRQRFVAGLAQRWERIHSADTASAQAAVLHQLTGAAGGYGLGALSEAARSAEQALLCGNLTEARAALNALHQLMNAECQQAGLAALRPGTTWPASHSDDT